MLGDKTNKKLRTYRLLKQNFGIETYLEVIDDKILRKCLSSFRISAYKLRIERVRYVRPREDLEKRLCLICNTIEDEIHFICKCKKKKKKKKKKYENERTLLYDNLRDMQIISYLQKILLKRLYNLLTNSNKYVENIYRVVMSHKFELHSYTPNHSYFMKCVCVCVCYYKL